MSSWRNRLSNERGATGLELAGLIAVAALIVGAVAAVIISSNPSIQASVEHAICVLTSGGDGDCGDAPEMRSPEDYIPPEQCVVSGAGQERSGSGSVSFVKLETGESWLIEELGNGQYRLTRVKEGGLGVTAGAGAEVYLTVDGQTYGSGAFASADALLAGEFGEVFYADSPEMAEAILRQQQTAETKDSVLGPFGSAAADWVGENTPLYGAPGEYEDLEPDEWWVEGGLDAGADASAISVVQSAEAEVAVEAYVGTKQRSDGSSADYFEVELSGQGSAVASNFFDTAVAEASGAASGVVELEKDADGNVVGMRVTSGLMGHADAGLQENLDNPTVTERTVEIPIETDADRQVAHNLMAAMGIPYTPGVSDGVSVDDVVRTPDEAFQAAEDFSQLARERGYVYEEEYELENNVDLGGGVNIGIPGISAGAGVEQATTARDLVDYRYWDGTAMVSREGCAA